MDSLRVRVLVTGRVQGVFFRESTRQLADELGLRGFVRNLPDGRVAGEQDIDGTSMWKVEMTIEPGNSGCPLLDMQGDVHGVMVMKSTGKDRFGFAVKVDHLRKLIERPNPIAMAKSAG